METVAKTDPGTISLYPKQRFLELLMTVHGGQAPSSSSISPPTTPKQQQDTSHPISTVPELFFVQKMELWHALVIAAVSVSLQAGLLVVIYYLLSRRLARHSENILKEVRPQDVMPSPADQPPPGAQVTQAERSTPESDLHYRHDSDTSSGSSSSSGSSPPTCQGIKDMNYTHVVFPDPERLKTESTLDYENIKEDKDYVNMNPQICKPTVWTFVNPAVSEPVEYTQVAM
ncbi:PREDICTED: uncharacterized protein C1orf186 homolog [Condylura cristata]|uniref:uncharacterized protein C1orf186 homolog n=1 Tax=Condylura cristata TaxID=143302 RepID=UPI0003343533|nr:PREDICTED: uncharacterized protein C1orf186 homolog [Condylura cristata]